MSCILCHPPLCLSPWAPCYNNPYLCLPWLMTERLALLWRPSELWPVHYFCYPSVPIWLANAHLVLQCFFSKTSRSHETPSGKKKNHNGWAAMLKRMLVHSHRTLGPCAPVCAYTSWPLHEEGFWLPESPTPTNVLLLSQPWLLLNEYNSLILTFKLVLYNKQFNTLVSSSKRNSSDHRPKD